MLIDFSFKNFTSFGDECRFDMLANSDKQHRESLIDDKYSRVRLIYGANASGKTSFIRRFSRIVYIKLFINHSLLRAGKLIMILFLQHHKSKRKFRRNIFSIVAELERHDRNRDIFKQLTGIKDKPADKCNRADE